MNTILNATALAAIMVSLVFIYTYLGPVYAKCKKILTGKPVSRPIVIPQVPGFIYIRPNNYDGWV
jgi:hypothetical protein